jgi:hypothetical protein
MPFRLDEGVLVDRGVEGVLSTTSAWANFFHVAFAHFDV